MYIYIIIFIVSLNFCWEQYLSYLNRKRMTASIPDELSGIYDENLYTKQQAYQKENSQFGLLTSGFSFTVILVMLLCSGFGFLDESLRQITENFIGLPLLYFGILLLTSQIIEFPFGWYDTFVIEEKFGFNKSTPIIFIGDALKSLLLSLILGGLILSVIIYIYEYTSEWFWLLAWGIITLFSVVMSMFYSEWIVPFFNKQTPLQEGGLRQEIKDFARKADFELTDIYVIDGSKRSTKANAYFSGLGKKKRIVLYDTLIEELETKEIIAVLAHEVGHYKKKHTLHSLLISIVNTGITCYILSFFLNNPALSEALGSDLPSFHLGLIGFSFLYSPISELTGLLFNYISRKNEYEADAYASSFGLAEALISGLKKISVKSLSNLNPHPWVVFWGYSHPTLLQRIKQLKENN